MLAGFSYRSPATTTPINRTDCQAGREGFHDATVKERRERVPAGGRLCYLAAGGQ